ncbi:glycosyl hydrolase family 18 protein [Brevibacillus ginsengisoli]|uniref:glycosyl hydrolase family 18 protein n=1 Tax=Brevibacillus ginsengisoli TaxID=363854 RepID=UPI003CF444C1
MKKLRRSLGICLLLGIVLLEQITSAKGLPFPDINNSYAKIEITQLQNQGIVVGDENGLFNPERAVTRAEFVTMLGRVLGLQPVNSSIQAFQDVRTDNWAYGWANAAAQIGIVSGTSPTTFAPARTITRQEAAAILVRSKSQQSSIREKNKLTDEDDVAPWALPYVKQAIASGLMNGFEGKFRPQGMLTRQELAVVLSRMLSEPSNGNNDQNPSIQLAWEDQGSTSDFIQLVQKSPVNVLSPRWFFLDENGELSDDGDINLVTWAHKNGRKVWAMVGNRSMDDATHQLVSDPVSRKAFIRSILQYTDKYQLDGINIDFENVLPSDRDDFTQFIRELSTALKSKGIILSVDVPPNLNNSWSDPFDYQILGGLVDYLIVMTYDEHWDGCLEAGSVSSLPWYDQHLREITTLVPSQKVIAGIPLYTRDWVKTGGNVQSQELLIQEEYDLLSFIHQRISWDPNIAQYIATYTRSNVPHTIWVEDSRSIAEKLKVSNKLGIKGAAYWSIEGGTDDVWAAVNNIVNSRMRYSM